VRENQRDVGLVRAVGPWALAASTVNIVIGAGIFLVPGQIAACIGPYAPLAYLACAVVIGAVTICFAEGGSRVPTSGGPVGCIDAAFGPLCGYIAGALMWVGDALACGSVAAALADAIASLAPHTWTTAVRVGSVIATIAGIALVNVGGVQRGTRLINAMTIAKLVPLAVFVIVGAGAVQGAHLLQGNASRGADVGRALILAVFAFTGMEVSLNASGEVAQPARTIPRALAIAMTSVTLLYIAVQVVAQGILGTALAQSSVPLADAMARINPGLRALMLFGAAMSMFGWLASDLLGSPRMLFALGRDGTLPRILGRLHPRTHAPYVAILAYATIAMALALSGTFVELAVLSTLTSAALYIGGSAAAWTLARRGVALAGTPLNFRWLTLAALIGSGGMLLMIALASRTEILGLLGLMAVAAVTYLVLARLRSSASVLQRIP
jgi:amino acid transporter